jgi:hypothetical protein
MQILERLAFERHALIAMIFVGHVVLLQLLQDNIFGAAEFRGPIRQTGQAATCCSNNSLTRPGTWSAAKWPTPGRTSKR